MLGGKLCPGCYLACLPQSEIKTYELKLVSLRSQKEEIMASILIEEERIGAVENELSEERDQLQSERAAFQEREDKLFTQQVTD